MDLSVAVALNSLKNITGEEKNEQLIILAFDLALELNHLEALEKLLRIYEGQVWPINFITSIPLRPCRQAGQ